MLVHEGEQGEFGADPALQASKQQAHQDLAKVLAEKHAHDLNAPPAYKPVPLLSIFIYTTLMALASGLGAVPFFIFGRLQEYWAGIANAVGLAWFRRWPRPLHGSLRKTVAACWHASHAAVPMPWTPCSQCMTSSSSSLSAQVAVGVMLSASFDLLHEGAPYSPMLTIAGMVIGALFIKASQDYLARVRRGWGGA